MFGLDQSEVPDCWVVNSYAPDKYIDWHTDEVPGPAKEGPFGAWVAKVHARHRAFVGNHFSAFRRLLPEITQNFT